MKHGVCVASKKKNIYWIQILQDIFIFDNGYLLVKLGISKTCLKKGKLVEVI